MILNAYTDVTYVEIKINLFNFGRDKINLLFAYKSNIIFLYKFLYKFHKVFF